MTEFYKPKEGGEHLRFLDGPRVPYLVHMPTHSTQGVVCAGEVCPVCQIADTQSTKRFCLRHRKFDFWNKRICDGCYAEHPLHRKPMTITEVFDEGQGS